MKTCYWRLIALGLILTTALVISAAYVRASSKAVHIPGLSAPVTIARDQWDVPHLSASSERDLFLAQGYITAQDRLWQMFLRRQAARGRLSEWLGPSAAEADALLIKQDFYAGLPQCPGMNLQAESQTTLNRSQPLCDVLEAYTAGVNAYLTQLNSSRPIEFTLLASRGVSATLEPWTVEDSLALARMMEWAQTLASPDPHLYDDLAARVGPERAQVLWLEGPAPRLIAPHSPAARQILQLASIPLFDSSVLSADYSAPALPPAWYMMGLHSQSYEAAGAALPGLPGIIAGRGTERAWDASWSEDTLAAGRASTPCATCVALQDVRQPSVSVSSEFARQLTPYLIALEPQGWLERRVTPMMEKWDYELQAASAPAAVYEAWVVALGRRAFADELGAELEARFAASGREPAVLARLALQPQDPWWDDVATPQRETRDDVIQLAYADALDYLGRHYGDLHTIWEWGQMHAATFEHALGDTWPATILLDRGPVFLGGDGLMVPPVPFDPSVSFEPALVPSLMWRVTATGELSFALAGEQSGALRLPLGGRLEAWQAGEFAPLLWAESDIKTNARSTLTLWP